MRKYLALIIVGLAVLACQVASAAGATAGTAAAAPSGPQWFVVIVKHATDMSKMDPAAMQTAMTGHINYLDDLYDKGVVYMAGPCTDDSGLGIGIAQANSADEARAAFEADPAYKAGLFSIEGVHPWWPAFNKPAGMKMTPDDMAAMASGKMAMPMSQVQGGATASASGGGASAGASSGNPMMTPGAVGFVEIPSSDVQASKAFYSKLFNWDFDSMAHDPAMAAMGNGFALFAAPGGMIGAFNAMFKSSTDGPIVYINCGSVKAKLAEVEAAGGKTALASMKLPGDWGNIGMFIDPQGNKLGLWSQSE